MASATRHRFPNFGTAPGNADGEQPRTSHASTLGQSFATGGTSWKGGIWGNSAIGSGLKGGLNDTGRAQENASALANNSEAMTGSGSLLSTSESDNWSLRQTTPWNAIDSTSPILSSSNRSHTSTSPVRHRNSNQHPPPQIYGENPRSSSPYFSTNQQAVNGNGMVNTASQKGFLDPISGSSVTSRTLDPGNLSGFSLNGDEENRQQAMSMVFGNSETGSLSQSGRQMFQQGMRSGHNSTIASRSGSIPPSRGGDEQHSYFGADVLTNPQSSRFGQGSTSFPSRPSHSTQTSTYSSHGGNRRYGEEQSSNDYNVDFITAEIRKMNPGKENEYPPYPSYQSAQEQSSLPYEYSQQLDGSAHAWSADEVGYQNGLGSFTPSGVPPGSQNLQHNHNHNPRRNIQFGEHSPQSPNGSDTRRSHHSPFYSTGGTPPSGDQYRAPSRGVANPRVPNGQAALLERKLRGLQQEQQTYIQPQPNPLHFRPSFPHPYEYNSQNAMRMNPLAQYYPMAPVPNFLPPIIPRGPSRDHDVGQNLRSALLEEFRSNSKTNKRYELKDIYNHIVEFSGDQHGSRFIQQKLETANSDEKDQVFREIQPNSIQLMTDVFGNYVIQKFFEHGNQSQKKILANQMKNHILTLSLQMYGCRVVQKALEHILTDQQASLVKELEQHVLRCVKDQNGNHVVQKAIERVPAEHIQFIINAFTGQVQSLATHPYGCRVIQRMLEHCAEPARTSVLQELHACASSLIVDQYGNYVTQHVIEHGRDGDRAKIISLVTSQLLTFSKHKFASNVVEKSIQFGSDEQRQMIVATLTALNEKNESPLQSLMRDQYGNYVIQKLLAQLAGSEYDEFVENIKPQLALLKRFSYGKQIAAIEKVIYSNPSTVQHNHNVSPPASVAPTPPPLTSDAQSPQSSSLPSTNNSTVDGPVGDRKARAETAVEVDVATTT